MIEIESQNYNEQTSYNKLTLRFYSSKLQLAFKDANIQSFIQNGRIALIVSISIYLLFGLTDFFIISDIFKEAIIIRFSIGAIMGIGSLILSYFNLFYKFGDKIIGFTVLMAGSSILYMIIASNSPLKNYYYFGFYIVVLVSNVFFRQSFLSCLLWSILFSFAFEFTTYITLGLSYLNLLNHWYFYSALLMLLVNSYNSEKHRINEFLLNREIEWHNYNLRDINNELDQLVAKKTEELQIAYENEKKASLLQHTFLMNISHQTRTPLNSIIGISEKWYLGENNTCSIEDLSRINESGKELLRIIDEIALYSKIEADSLTIKHEEFSLCSLLTSSRDFTKESIKKRLI